MSMKEVMDKGSPAVRRLFDAEGSSGGEKGVETGAVNIDKFMQRTGKVSNIWVVCVVSGMVCVFVSVCTDAHSCTCSSLDG